jgi:hypothetical protein
MWDGWFFGETNKDDATFYAAKLIIANNILQVFLGRVSQNAHNFALKDLNAYDFEIEIFLRTKEEERKSQQQR